MVENYGFSLKAVLVSGGHDQLCCSLEVAMLASIGSGLFDNAIAGTIVEIGIGYVSSGGFAQYIVPPVNAVENGFYRFR